MTCVIASATECNFLTQLDKTLETIALDFDFELSDLCRTMAMSRTTLHRRITDCAGISTSLYIRSFRLKKAYELLQTTNQPIGDIAFSVGFSNIAYFARCFKEKYGESARAIRQKNRLE